MVELTLHTVDIQHATGHAAAFPAVPSALTRDVVLSLVGRADALAVACALTGRRGAPVCDVLS